MIDPRAESGTTFEGPLRVLSFARIRAFSAGPLGAPGWPERNPHTDTRLARDAGFPALVASGFQAEGDLVRLMTSLFGTDWAASGTLRVKFVAPLFAGDCVRAMARLRATETQGTLRSYRFEVWCEKENGDKIVVGEATGRLP